MSTTPFTILLSRALANADLTTINSCEVEDTVHLDGNRLRIFDASGDGYAQFRDQKVDVDAEGNAIAYDVNSDRHDFRFTMVVERPMGHADLKG